MDLHVPIEVSLQYILDKWIRSAIPVMRSVHGMVNYLFQTDNEEFKSERCRDAIELSVGRLITSATYSPETMSIIERSWRTIGEMASTDYIASRWIWRLILEGGNDVCSQHLQSYSPIQAGHEGEAFFRMRTCIMSAIFSAISSRLGVQMQRGFQSVTRIIVDEVSK